MTVPVRIAISLGDPAGIGTEVTLKALQHPRLRRRVAPVLFGDLTVARETVDRLRLKMRFLPATAVDDPHGAIPLVEVATLPAGARRPGRPSRAGGEAAFQAIVAAVRSVQGGHTAAVVTAPISKANIVAAGHEFAGHTELLTELSKAPCVRMMMAGPRLRVVLVTTHVALRKVPSLLTPGRIGDTITLTQQTLRTRFGIRRPRIAVCGLNPHAGEAGLFGQEDERVIRPAVQQARRRGVQAIGPLPADSVFAHAVDGRYDAVVCMYHDQGLAPFKLLHFRDGVNVTLGLPFVRTSPDHGTAYDIAGRGVADPSSMIAAIELAMKLARPAGHTGAALRRRGSASGGSHAH